MNFTDIIFKELQSAYGGIIDLLMLHQELDDNFVCAMCSSHFAAENCLH